MSKVAIPNKWSLLMSYCKKCRAITCQAENGRTRVCEKHDRETYQKLEKEMGSHD